MALIKCPDCGKMFSEYAVRCPDCGCPIEQPKNQNKTCPECGQEVDASVMVCPNCAFPLSHTKGNGKDGKHSNTTNTENRNGKLIVDRNESECPFCGENISDKASTCPHCGYVVRVIEEQTIQHNPQRRSRHWGKLFLIVVVALTAFFAWNTIKQNENKNAEYKERIYQKSGIKLRGDYTDNELRAIINSGKAVIEGNDELAKKIKKQEGLSLDDIPPF